MAHVGQEFALGQTRRFGISLGLQQVLFMQATDFSVGQEPGHDLEQRNFVLGPVSFVTHGVEADKAEAMPGAVERNRHQGLNALRFKNQAIPAALRQIEQAGNVDQLAPGMVVHPVGQYLVGHRLEVVDFRGDAGRTPLMGIAHDAGVEVIEEKINAVDVGKLASHGQRIVDSLIEFLQRRVDKADGQIHDHLLESRTAGEFLLDQNAIRDIPAGTGTTDHTAILGKNGPA